MRTFSKGILAEDAVRRDYEARGYTCIERRKRVGRTEIDLIFQKRGVTVFVEVKASQDHEKALARICPAQTARLFEAAIVYLGQDQGDLRIDVAAVNARGDVLCLENAFAGA